MLLSYRGRLRRDLQGWRERGLIDAAQHDRIAAEALAPPGIGYLQGVLVFCFVVLAAPAVIAFVAANWAGMAPAIRMAVLVSADVACVFGAWFAFRRAARRGTPGARAIADGAATLSLALAAGTLALVGQTFHVPSNLPGFAATVAVLGLATALVARSGGAALCACVALAVADVAPGEWGAAKVASPMFWPVGLGLFAGFLSGWLPARKANLLILLVVLARHLEPAASDLAGFGADRLLTVGVLALGLGRASGMVGGLPERIREGGQALAQAAAGVCLLGILAVAARTLGWSAWAPGPWIALALGGVVMTATLLLLPWRRGRQALPLADLIVLGAAASALLVPLCGGAPREAPAFWTVWGGILPALGLVVAGHLDDRHTLFGWSLAAVGGLIVGMLATSRDLLGFSANLLGSAALVALTLALCRWADRRLADTTLDGRPA